MLFNSFKFLLFFPFVFTVYWVINSLPLLARSKFRINDSFTRNTQNLFILSASYLFYGAWNVKFLSLLSISSIVDYTLGYYIGNSKRVIVKKVLLLASITVNLGILGFFKYYNFFLDSFVSLSESVGFQVNLSFISVVLPVGISFYTFQTLSYSIDVYRGKLKPTKNIISFMSYVAFFPQLVAGPIERAVNLLPQFEIKRRFDYDKAVIGMRQILWGFFKKVVIADSCAPIVNEIFSNSAEASSIALIFGAVFFAFQIYGDFSGYSDIAIGLAKLLGFELMQNFAFPYFSRDIAEFWRRWHISLSTWFRDYLYIPLGGSRGSKYHKVRNVFIIFLVSGLWHGANWTFVFWGGLNAFFFLPLLLFKFNRVHIEVVASNSIFPSFKDILAIFLTFSLTCFAWIFFRAQSLSEAFIYVKGLFTKINVPIWNGVDLNFESFDWLIFYLLFFFSLEWLNRTSQFGFTLYHVPKWIRVTLYIVVFALVVYHFGEERDFIYFQF